MQSHLQQDELILLISSIRSSQLLSYSHLSQLLKSSTYHLTPTSQCHFSLFSSIFSSTNQILSILQRTTQRPINSSPFSFQGAPVTRASVARSTQAFMKQWMSTASLECKLFLPLRGGCITGRFLIVTAFSTVTFTQNVP